MQEVKLNRLKEVLAEKGIKQTWLAERLGFSTVIVNMWCNNKAQPSLNKLSQIALILDVDLRDLVQSSIDHEKGDDKF